METVNTQNTSLEEVNRNLEKINITGEDKVISHFIKRSSEQFLNKKTQDERKGKPCIKKRSSELNIMKKKHEEKVILPQFIKRSSEQNLNKRKHEEMKVISHILKRLSEQDIIKKQEVMKVPLNIFKKSVEAAVHMNFMKYKQHDTDLKHQQEQLNEVKKAIQKFPYFKEWSNEVIREGCNLSKIETFQPNETILGDGKGEHNFVYFVLEGLCQMIQDLRIAILETRKRKHFRHISEEEDPRPHEHVVTYFMQVCLMDKGECFGIGEALTHRRIVALTHVKCLLCPHHWLVQNTQANIWERIKQFLNRHLPKNDELFKKFVEQRHWLEYRGKVIREISHCKTNNTTIHDVPYSIRITEASNAIDQ